MNFRILPLAVLALFIVLGASPRNAVAGPIVDFRATLSGENEVPPVATEGRGVALVSLDTDSLLLSWEITWSNLTGEIFAMHFHGPGAPTENAQVQVNIGSISGLTSPSVGSTVITADQAGHLLDGLWYVNIHTDAFAAGEIRGQVLRVTEPAALALFSFGAVAAVSLSRRRRAS
ncbi:CHRD domain-containing protein [Caenispirillum salinarum]|uniref:CHRD domain-containing protein n=1 Tax=Caenispirillum salinarum TaxID=859058 RepID=UPI00384CD33E